MAAEGKQEKLQLPRIDFSGVDPSAPGAGQWAAVRAHVVDALATFGCFDAHYPALGPDLRAALFDGAVRELFELPADTKRRNTYGPDKPLYGYLAGIPGLANGYESLAIADRVEPERVRAFADLMWPDGGNTTFCETVHGAAKRIAELEEAVRRMVMEGLGVVKYHDALSESTRHVFRMSRYRAPDAAAAEGMQKQVRYGTHQDCNTLTVVCQHQVDGLEVQARDGDWILVTPSSPESLVVMAGNALRAWTNDRVHAPFHRVTVGGDADRYTALLFVIPDYKIEAPDELVDEQHPRRFKPHYTGEFIRYCVAQGARHQDKLEAFCGI